MESLTKVVSAKCEALNAERRRLIEEYESMRTQILVGLNPNATPLTEEADEFKYFQFIQAEVDRIRNEYAKTLSFTIAIDVTLDSEGEIVECAERLVHTVKSTKIATTSTTSNTVYVNDEAYASGRKAHEVFAPKFGEEFRGDVDSQLWLFKKAIFGKITYQRGQIVVKGGQVLSGHDELTEPMKSVLSKMQGN